MVMKGLSLPSYMQRRASFHFVNYFPGMQRFYLILMMKLGVVFIFVVLLFIYRASHFFDESIYVFGKTTLCFISHSATQEISLIELITV